MTMEELSTAFQRLHQRYELDVQWHMQNLEVMNDHAEMIDQHKGFLKTTVTEVNTVRSELEETKRKI